jgi:acyl carrier protein phosphodiesterase
MNFLAHIYLSGDHDEIRLGNFMADAIKGKKYTEYQPFIQVGILLHREIDTFTDSHPVFRKSTKRLHKQYSHFSGVIIDIFYDHFLAKNWLNYSSVPLDIYADNFYKLLLNKKSILPERTLKLMPFLIEYNWLLSYATINGINSVLAGMNRRTHNRGKIDKAGFELKQFYSDFESEFSIFFDDAILFSEEKRNQLLHHYKLG